MENSDIFVLAFHRHERHVPMIVVDSPLASAAGRLFLLLAIGLPRVGIVLEVGAVDLFHAGIVARLARVGVARHFYLLLLIFADTVATVVPTSKVDNDVELGFNCVIQECDRSVVPAHGAPGLLIRWAQVGHNVRHLAVGNVLPPIIQRVILVMAREQWFVPRDFILAVLFHPELVDHLVDRNHVMVAAVCHDSSLPRYTVTSCACKRSFIFPTVHWRTN